MKFLKKINKGLILTVIVLLILIIYLIGVEAKKNAQKPEIEAMCKEYISAINKYTVLPESYQKLYNEDNLSENETKETITENVKKVIDTQMDNMEKELSDKMIDTTVTQKEIVKSLLIDNNDVFSSIITNFDKEITKIKKFQFDKDQVIVTFDAKINKENKYLGDDGKEYTNQNTIVRQDESITLKKIDDVWKVVYAELSYDDYYETSYMSFY